jgi:sulfopyruvate decarboxylase TPP-binding subunit
MSNGATALVKTLVNAGITTCFSNPGTSEMHFVAALDSAPEMRAVLTLFEGVATGAADGYARMADKPAATLLHLGCGLGNGLANLHNARKGKLPILNIVGDHATYHTQYDSQLQSDIETVARNVSPGFVRTSKTTETLCLDAGEAIAACMGPPGQVATLILPADVSWGEGGVPAPAPQIAAPPMADDATVAAVAAALQGGGKTAILLGGRALRAPALMALARIAAQTGAKLFSEVFPTRLERGAGLPPIERLAYLAELASVQLTGLDNLVLVDVKAPVSFFAYPGKKSYLVPEGCQVLELATFQQDVMGSLDKLARAVGAEKTVPALQALKRPGLPRGKFAWIGLHLTRSSLDEKGTADETEHSVAQVEDEPHVVLDDHDGEAAVPDLEDQVHRLLGLLRVHAGGGLVEQQHLRVGRQGSSDLQAPLVAVGHVARQELGGLAEPDVVEEFLGPLTSGRLVPLELRSAQDGGQWSGRGPAVAPDHDVLEGGHVAEESDVLEGPGHAGHDDLARLRREHLTTKRHGALGGDVHPGEAVEEGRLPGPVGADQPTISPW